MCVEGHSAKEPKKAASKGNYFLYMLLVQQENFPVVNNLNMCEMYINIT